MTSADITLRRRATHLRSSVGAWCARLAPHVRRHELTALRLGFVALGAALVFGRVSLPLGLAFGYRSSARNLALLFLAGALLGGARRLVPRSQVGPALLAFLVVAALSLLGSEGGAGNLRMLASGLGVFYATRRVCDARGGRRWLFHWLGLIVVAVLVRELWNDPSLLALHAARRLEVVTENPNTLGFAAALLTPLFLARTGDARDHRLAWTYAACGSVIVLLSYSRAAWVGLALGTLLLALDACVRERDARVTKPVVAAGALALLVAAITLVSHERGFADAQRLRIGATSLSLLAEHWLTGIGFGGQSLARWFPERHLELYGESLFLFHSHNLYLDVLVGTGAAGALALAVLLGTLARGALRSVHTARTPERRREALGDGVAIAVFLLLSFVDTPLYHGRLVVLGAVTWAMAESTRLRSSASAAQKSGSTRAAQERQRTDSRSSRDGTGFAHCRRQTSVRPRTATTDGP